jgi:hypothetical protein
MRRLVLTLGASLVLGGSAFAAPPEQAPVQKPVQAPAPVQAPVQKAVQAPAPVQKAVQAPVQKMACNACQSPVQKGAEPVKTVRVGVFGRVIR